MSQDNESGQNGSSSIEYQAPVAATGQEINDITNVSQVNPDEERSPKVADLPTSGTAGRLLLSGVVTEVRDVGEEQKYLQCRVVAADGAPVFLYAGEYQPGPMATMEDLETPVPVVALAKPRTYETEDGDIRSSLVPERMQAVGMERRNTIALEMAKQTLDRSDGGSSYDESAKAILRDLAGQEESDAKDSEETATGQELLDKDEIAMRGGVRPKQAEILASSYTEIETLIDDVEDGDVEELDGIGPATIESLQENTDRLSAVA